MNMPKINNDVIRRNIETTKYACISFIISCSENADRVRLISIMLMEPTRADEAEMVWHIACTCGIMSAFNTSISLFDLHALLNHKKSK